jgi:hypothetical protein
LFSPTREEAQTLPSPTRRGNQLIRLHKLSGYQIGQVNSHRESWASERLFRPAPASGGEHASAKNGRIPGPFRPGHRAERLSAYCILAEGEELSSNPLRAFSNDLRTTQNLVDVAWRFLDCCGGLLPSFRAALCHDLHVVDPTQNAAAVYAQIPPAETRATVQDQVGASDSEGHNRGPHQVGKAEHGDRWTWRLRRSCSSWPISTTRG